MDWLVVAAGVFIFLSALQLNRVWEDLEPRMRWGNVSLIVGVTIAVVAPAVVETLGMLPVVGTALRVVGLLFVLGAAWAIMF